MDVTKVVETNEDTELVSRIRAGDKGAEAQLLHRFYRGAMVVINASGGHNGAEDLCQQAFIITLEAIRNGEVRHPDKLKAFISQVARNLCIEHARKRRKQEQQVGEGTDLPDTREGPFEQLLQKEFAGIVVKALKGLKSQRDRDVLIRFYLEEQDKEAICSDIGLNSTQFNLVLFRARKQFARSYNKLLMGKPRRFRT